MPKKYLDFIKESEYMEEMVSKRIVKYKAWTGENDGDEVHVYVNNVFVFTEKGHLNSSDELKNLLKMKGAI